MGFLINQYQSFGGNAVEMASAANQCAQYLQLPGDLEKINERLVRYYVAEGLVDRPKRIGRDAEYGYLHLLQFLAGRFLVDAGFPMQKVAPYLASMNIPQLETLVMNKTKPNMAELLVASFASPKAGSKAKRKDEDWLMLNKQDPGKSSLPSVGNSVLSDAIQSKAEPITYSNLQSLSSDSRCTPKADNFDDLAQLTDRVSNLSSSIEQHFERMRLLMQEERAQWREDMERERRERNAEYLELREKLNQLMAMMAQGKEKGKEHD